MRQAAGLHPDPLGSYSALPDSLAVIRGRGGRLGKEWAGNREGREGRERVERDGKGEGAEGATAGKGEGGST